MDQDQEMLQKAIMLKQQSEEVERQLNFVKEQISELEKFSENLKVLDESKEKEILANLGRGVHMKVDRKTEEKLFVEAGAGVLVRKTPKEAREIIQEQIKKFNEARLQLTAQLEEYASEFRKMIAEVEKVKEKGKE